MLIFDQFEFVFKIFEFCVLYAQSNVQEYQAGVDNLIAIAKKITDTEFLLQLRNLDMPDRKVMKKLLEFLTEQVKFEVSKR